MTDDQVSGPDARIIPVEELVSPDPIAGLAFWRDSGGTRGLPPVAAIDPLALRRLLAKIVIFEVIWPAAKADGAGPETDPEDFEYRLLGEDAVNMLGNNLKGRRVSSLTEFGDSYIRRNIAFYSLICRLRQPLGATGQLEMIGKSYREFEAVYLPFSHDGSRVDRIVAVLN